MGRKCINETYVVCTKDTRIMIAIFDDGSIEKEFEDYLINEQKHIIERINHCNRDKNNNRYTTRKIIHFSEYGWEEWNKEYEMYIKKQTMSKEEISEELDKAHLIHLAKCEEHYRRDGSYLKASSMFKQNSINRINHYINIRKPKEKEWDEYQVFIDSMNKSLEMLMK